MERKLFILVMLVALGGFAWLIRSKGLLRRRGHGEFAADTAQTQTAAPPQTATSPPRAAPRRPRDERTEQKCNACDTDLSFCEIECDSLQGLCAQNCQKDRDACKRTCK